MRRSRRVLISSSRLAFASLDLNPAYQGQILDRRKSNHVLAARIGVGGELFDDSFVPCPSGGKDVEVGQHLRTVDAHVENSGVRCRPECLGKMQSYRMAGP